MGQGEVYSLVCALIWAVGVILFRKSGEHVSPVALNLFKNAVGLGLFLVTLPLLGVPLIPEQASWRDWTALVASGVIGIAVADSMFFASLNRLGAGNVAIVDSLYSPFVIVCAFVYLREPVTASVLGAMVLVTAAILVGTWRPRMPGVRRQVVGGVALGLGAVFFMAVALVLLKPVLAHSDPWWVTTVRLMAGTAFLAVQAAGKRHRADVWRSFRPGRGWLVTVPAALVGCYLAMITWIWGMKYTYASTASILNQMSTIFVLVLAAIFLRERVTMRRAAAVAMAFAGAVLVSW